MEKLGISVLLISEYHPQSNRQVECLNQKTGRYIQSFCNNNQNDWVMFLAWVRNEQISLHHSATKIIPFQYMLEYQPPLIPWNAMPKEVSAVVEWFKQSKQL